MEDIHISGSGTVKGGEYRSITIGGMGKCTGSLRALDIAINGTFKSEDSIECRALTVNGTLKSEGNLSVEEMVCNGMAKVEGSLVANQLNISGILHTEGSELGSQKLTCTGILTVDGRICCDALEATGIIKAEALEGRQISIRSQRPKLLLSFLPPKGFTKIQSIQGEELVLAGVDAQRVSGVNITIGPDCRMEELECSGTLQLDPAAVIGSISGDYTLL